MCTINNNNNNTLFAPWFGFISCEGKEGMIEWNSLEKSSSNYNKQQNQKQAMQPNLNEYAVDYAARTFFTL